MGKLLPTLVALGIATLAIATVLAVPGPPSSLPIPAGTRFEISPNQVVLIRTAAAVGGTLVGAWTSTGTTCVIFVFFHSSVPAGWANPGSPACARSGSMNRTIPQAGGYTLVFSTVLGATAPINVSVTQTIQVVYGP